MNRILTITQHNLYKLQWSTHASYYKQETKHLKISTEIKKEKEITLGLKPLGVLSIGL